MSNGDPSKLPCRRCRRAAPPKPHEEVKTLSCAFGGALLEGMCGYPLPCGDAKIERVVSNLVGAIFRRHPSGCCWHIVLDDGNVEDDNVAFCREKAKSCESEDCRALGPLMGVLTETEREAFL